MDSAVVEVAPDSDHPCYLFVQDSRGKRVRSKKRAKLLFSCFWKQKSRNKGLIRSRSLSRALVPQKRSAANPRRAALLDCRFKYAPNGGNYRQTSKKKFGEQNQWVARKTLPLDLDSERGDRNKKARRIPPGLNCFAPLWVDAEG